MTEERDPTDREQIDRIATMVVREYLKKEEPFTAHEIEQEIAIRGGVASLGPGYGVRDYLEDVRRSGGLTYRGWSGTYMRT